MKCAHCSIGIKVQKTQTVKQYHPKIVWTSNNIETFTGRRCNEDEIGGIIIFKIWCKINSYIIVSVLLNPYSALSSFFITLKISQLLMKSHLKHVAPNGCYESESISWAQISRWCENDVGNEDVKKTPVTQVSVTIERSTGQHLSQPPAALAALAGSSRLVSPSEKHSASLEVSRRQNEVNIHRQHARIRN